MADLSPIGDAVTPELIARIVDLMPAGVLAKDPRRDLRYVIWNEAMATMTGIEAATVLGHTDAEIYPPEIARLHADADQEVLETGRLLRREGQVSQHTIAGHVVNTSKLLLRDGSGEPALVLTLIEDVTEQRRLERQVLQAQKMEAVSRLAGGIAHDFNNLLQVIMGYGELTRGDLPAGKNQQDMDRILKAGSQAQGVVSQLLTFSRQEFVRTETLDLEDLIETQLDVLRRVLGEDMSLEWRPAGNLPPALADPEHMRQVLLDLCINARDAMPGGGTITIGTSHDLLDEAWCLRNPELNPGHYVNLVVSDTGMGIPPELQTTIFEPFFTTKNVGSGGGLGLAAVYAAARAHGGSVSVGSSPGEGATFTVRLPAADAPAPALETDSPHAVSAPTAARPARDVGRGRLVLVAEDQDEVRELCASILERAGYRVLRASDGVQAVEMFHACTEAIDLLLLDVVMPRLNGRDAYEAMVDGRDPIPVIFCSGYDDNILTRDFLLEIPGELLQKPYHPNELLARVATTCGRRARADSGD